MLFDDRRFIFFPDSFMMFRPEQFGYVDYEDHEVMTPDGVLLHAWLLRSQKPCGVTVLFFHGNAGNISHRLENASLLSQRGLDVFLVDYRGYGRSNGEPSEQGLCTDAGASFEYLLNLGLEEEQIAVFGRSLGGAVAVDLAAGDDRVRRLALESTFTSVPDLARVFIPFLPVGAIMRTKFKSRNKVGKIACPKLHLHGTRDDLIPYENGRALYEASSEPKAFFPIEGAGHNDTYDVGGEPYFDALTGFMISGELPDCRT